MTIIQDGIKFWTFKRRFKVSVIGLSMFRLIANNPFGAKMAATPLQKNTKRKRKTKDNNLILDLSKLENKEFDSDMRFKQN